MNDDTFYTKTVSGKMRLERINPESTALLVIDMQNDFIKEGSILEVPKIREQIPKIKKLIEACRELGMPIVYTRQVYRADTAVRPLVLDMFSLLDNEGLREGTEGAEIHDELKPLPNDFIVKKLRFSGFYNTDLESILRNIRGRRTIDTVIICGTVTNICCESTARDAFERDYRVVFGSDITSAWSDEFQKLSLQIIDYAFGWVMSCEEIIRALRVKT
ncbi:MAG: cysteine hydrolase family protein [Candidatus Thorarchaeota archaeon]|jgi:ureidoacrylate peracid hydrolase